MLRRVLLASSCVCAALTWSAGAFAQSTTPAPQGGSVGPAGVPVGKGPSSPQPRQPGASRSDAGQRAAPTRQDVNAASATEVGEVVVTAARRGDTVQRAPIAITAFTDERRNLLGIENARDITNLTPSLSLQGEYLTLRGVGRYEDPGQGTDPGVAISVDGVYTSSPAYLNQPDFLTDRIEVVPGPNSVFGRNSVGGTVNVISKRPTDDFHVDLRAGYTSFDESYVQGAVSGPIAPTLKFKLGYAFSNDPNTPSGPQKNLAPGVKEPNSGDTRLYDAQLEWTPTSDIDVWFRYQGFSENLSGAYGVETGLGGGVGVASPYLTGTPATYASIGFDSLAPNPQYGLPGNANPSASDRFKTLLDDPGRVELKGDDTFTINFKWDLHFATLTYLGGYSQYDYFADTDADGTDRKSFIAPGTSTQPNGYVVASEYIDHTVQRKKFSSHEVILTSPDNQPLRWVLGGYYYEERYKTSFATADPLATYLAAPLNGKTFAPAAPNPNDDIYSQLTALRSKNEAVYGQLDYDLTSKIRLTGFIRGNFDQRFGSDAFREIYDLYGFGGLVAGGGAPLGLDVTPSPGAASARANFSDWTGKVAAEYHPDNTLTAYASVSRGYKSGGFDLGAFAPIPEVKPEVLTDYEGGVKKSWGRSFLIDAALYYYDYSNLQVPITTGSVVNNPLTGPGLIYTPTTVNAQTTHSIGLELQSVWSPLKDLHLTFVYSYLYAQFIDFTSPTGAAIHDPSLGGRNYANLDGNTIPQAPRNKFAILPQYVIHLPANTDLSLSSTLSFTDKEYYAVFNTPNYTAPSYYNLDLRAVLQPRNSHFTAIFYGRNVTNTTQYIFFGASGTGATAPLPEENLYTVYPGRVFGLELQYRY